MCLFNILSILCFLNLVDFISRSSCFLLNFDLWLFKCYSNYVLRLYFCALLKPVLHSILLLWLFLPNQASQLLLLHKELAPGTVNSLHFFFSKLLHISLLPFYIQLKITVPVSIKSLDEFCNRNQITTCIHLQKIGILAMMCAKEKLQIFILNGKILIVFNNEGLEVVQIKMKWATNKTFEDWRLRWKGTLWKSDY